MATKNIVPRANGEGGIGTSAKRWLNGFFKNVTVDTSLNTVTPGNTDNSTKAATTAFVENTFFNKLVAKLLATTAATITSLSTSSLFYRFLAQALSVAGVQYNLSNSSAWYICLGSLFGGLIIQGGRFPSQSVTIPAKDAIAIEVDVPLTGEYFVSCASDFGGTTFPMCYRNYNHSIYIRNPYDTAFTGPVYPCWFGLYKA